VGTNAIQSSGAKTAGTVIAYATNNRLQQTSEGHGIYRGVFVAAGCDDLTIANLTIDNNTRAGVRRRKCDYSGPTAQRAKISNVIAYSYQDTSANQTAGVTSAIANRGDVD